jgi:hypothetical protein
MSQKMSVRILCMVIISSGIMADPDRQEAGSRRPGWGHEQIGFFCLGVEEIPALRYLCVTECGISDAQTFEPSDWYQQSGGFFMLIPSVANKNELSSYF